MRIIEEFEENSIQIQSLFDQTDICFELIVPDYSIQEFREEDEEEWDEIIGENEKKNEDEIDENEIEIDLKQSFHYLRNKNNEDSFKIIEDSLLQFHQKYIPLIKTWLKILTKVKLQNQEEIEIQLKYLEKVKSIKERMKYFIDKCRDLDLKIIKKRKKNSMNDEQEEEKKKIKI